MALFFVFVFGIDLDPERASVAYMAGVASLMAVWWITNAIPLAATSLLPLVLFPLLGILSSVETAPIYMDDKIFLYVGGFLIALAMERWGLHRRIALNIIRVIGGSPSRLVLGFMVTSALLSMWISNTATAIMMLAIGLAIIVQMESLFDKVKTRNLSVSLLLGIAYGCSIGGIATPVGTPPNISLMGQYARAFPDAEPISFGQWMAFGLPLSILLLGLAWFLLTRILFKVPEELRLSPESIEKERRALGRICFAEVFILCVFSMTAVLWVFRKDLTLPFVTIPGWSDALPFGKFLTDGSVAVTMAMLLFMVPSRKVKGEMLLDSTVFAKIPWDIILLFGGGFALAKGFMVTGLSDFIGMKFESLSGVPPLVLVAVICLGITFLTELTSNTATTEMVLPILASVAVAMKVEPLLLMVPATISASCAFMLPVATPPNAIVFGSGRIKIGEMVRAGLVLNLIAVVLVTVLFYTLGRIVFGV